MADDQDSEQSVDDQSGIQQTADDQSQEQGTTEDQNQEQTSQDQGTTDEQCQEQQAPEDQSQEQGAADEQSQEQQTPEDQSQEQGTADEQSQEQQTPEDQSQEQGTADEQGQEQTSQDQTQDQGTVDEQSQEQQTPEDEGQDQGTTGEQSQGQQTAQGQGQNRQTTGDQAGRQTPQSGATGSKQSFVGQTTGATQTQGAGVQTQPQGRLGLGDHIWYYNGKISTDKNVPRATWFPNSNQNDPNDYQGHGGEIWHYVIHANGQIFAGQPHLRNQPGTFAWLNNNPGNITAGGGNYGQYQGKVNWHDFLIFPTAQIGFDAIRKLLKGPAYSNLSILAAMRKYAPATDGNRPDDYAAQVAAEAGVSVNTIVGTLNDSQVLKMQNKIRDIEGTIPGRTLTRNDPTLPAAVHAALA
jgi:hypothetical protein